jgi:hypothetical protein
VLLITVACCGLCDIVELYSPFSWYASAWYDVLHAGIGVIVLVVLPIFSKAVCVCVPALKGMALPRESLRRDRTDRLTSPAAHACGTCC